MESCRVSNGDFLSESRLRRDPNPCCYGPNGQHPAGEALALKQNPAGSSSPTTSVQPSRSPPPIQTHPEAHKFPLTKQAAHHISNQSHIQTTPIYSCTMCTYTPSASRILATVAAAAASTGTTPRPVRRSSTLDESTVQALEKYIGQRPDKHELQERNILKQDNVAPALQAAKEKLQRSQLEDKLDQKLQQRPKPEELVKDGILSGRILPAFLPPLEGTDRGMFCALADEAPIATA
ncbi:hypothetical protein EVG20_g3032 [Dentipellis fragilis]|uniref:RPEL repeat protein n=1 Tax=Dentipellis fragilis TaxID=205917 RepID=A0A4Y9Z5G6_9AGAM|nr:hypothetical protein EVG20_g3032 [Dentipellis fragilis]